MPGLQRLAPVLALALLSACRAQAFAPVETAPASARPRGDPLASCGVRAALTTALADALTHGRAPEDSAMGACVAKAARNGSTRAAMLLAELYRLAVMASEAPGDGSAALGLDLYGRHLAWLHRAAEQGFAPAQLLLAQETDDAVTVAMPEVTLAWYQTAAERGSRSALAAIAAGYSQGRIPYERLYDFRNWLAGQAHTDPACRQALRSLSGPAPVALR